MRLSEGLKERIRGWIEKINQQNRDSTCSPDVRRGWCSMLEDMLMGMDCYAGWNLYTDQMPDVKYPGMVKVSLEEWDKLEYPEKIGTDTYTYKQVDETRRFYYVHQKLQAKSAA